MTSAVQPHQSRSDTREWSILAQALALQESGILVQGMSVTDLSTGFCVEGPPEAMSPDYVLVDPETTSGKHSLGDDIALWGTKISVARLGELTVLLDEVVQQREENPDAASVNPAVPRETFPWGIGLDTVDILVAGAHAKIIAAYLRVMGYRARVVDENEALSIAAELTAAGPFVEKEACPTPAPEPADSEHDDGEHDRERQESSTLKALIAVALVVVVAGIGVMVASLVTGRDTPREDVVAEGAVASGENPAQPDESAGSPEPPISTPSSAPPQPPQKDKQKPKAHNEGRGQGRFEDPQKMGGKRETHAPRADVPVTVGVPGWKRAGATKGREEYRSADEGMRVLIAAKPTPLRRQADLDQAVLRALEQAQGVRVVKQSPVVYEEKYPGSATQWHVVLRDGHQVSVGCQVREHTAHRDEQCRKIVRAARPE